MIKTLVRPLAWVLIAGSVCVAEAAEEQPASWPDKVVTIEELQPLTSFHLTAPRPPAVGAVRGASVLRARIDNAGGVAEVVLLESCGNPSLDEAALRALRGMQFKPYTAGGVPMAVTLVLPVHIPKHLGRSRQGR